MSTVQTLCDETDVSYRQANHWISKGYIPDIVSEGSGYPLTLNGKQADVFRVMALLVKTGFVPAVASKYANDYVSNGVERYMNQMSNLSHVVMITLHGRPR